MIFDVRLYLTIHGREIKRIGKIEGTLDGIDTLVKFDQSWAVNDGYREYVVSAGIEATAVAHCYELIATGGRMFISVLFLSA